MTNPIGGDIRDLPKKALRNIFTPLIENLDDQATDRLKARLTEEQQIAADENSRRALLRAEILQDMKHRQRSLLALERLSGLPPRAQTAPKSILVSTEVSRVENLAKPRNRKFMKTGECLDGLELTHISNPEVLHVLHS